ncbi:hypothetical protein SteCoe_4079 [Stentor coeruleus]|uniref:C2H2-type domain-containing protein n=1 Tax=Stentor coeruleus TaxID=5963 RepID=A0A1R2CVJ2_9CILI|nr:hypothetical protein SteCoe_4079 [Stentor coeruleus]
MDAFEKVEVLYCCPFPGCSKEYKVKFNLRRHVQMIHIKMTFHRCRVCAKSFSSRQVLKEHFYRHSKVKPYYCAKCGKRFRQYSHLSSHRKSHSN